MRGRYPTSQGKIETLTKSPTINDLVRSCRQSYEEKGWGICRVETSSYEQRVHELDQRQDEILERVAELDQQIQSLIEVWAPKREASPAAAPISESQEQDSDESAITLPIRRAA